MSIRLDTYWVFLLVVCNLNACRFAFSVKKREKHVCALIYSRLCFDHVVLFKGNSWDKGLMSSISQRGSGHSVVSLLVWPLFSPRPTAVGLWTLGICSHIRSKSDQLTGKEKQTRITKTILQRSLVGRLRLKKYRYHLGYCIYILQERRITRSLLRPNIFRNHCRHLCKGKTILFNGMFI